MSLLGDPAFRAVVLGLFSVLVLASVAGFALAQRVTGESGRDTVANVNARIRSWWLMCAVFTAALLLGTIGVILLFALVSFLALREFITITPTRRADHRTLVWVFFLFTPLQYYLVAIQWYGLFSILIPVYAFLFIPLLNALAGDYQQFLDRTAKVQWGLMLCVYCVSHMPALLTLRIPGFEEQGPKLLLYLALVAQSSDVLQYLWGKSIGRRPIAPTISPTKTWEGFIGGILCATLLGTALWWLTPFQPWQAALMAGAITLTGFAGGLTLSAIKRDRGIKDYGALLEGHGGILDRIDSLCFSAPLFFHLTRYFFQP